MFRECKVVQQKVRTEGYNADIRTVMNDNEIRSVSIRLIIMKHISYIKNV